MKTIKCKKCGHEHACSRLAPKEAAFIRWAKEKKNGANGTLGAADRSNKGRGTRPAGLDAGLRRREDGDDESRTVSRHRSPAGMVSGGSETPVAPTLGRDVDQAKEAQMKAFIERMERKR